MLLFFVFYFSLFCYFFSAVNKGGVGKISHFPPPNINIPKTAPDTATTNDQQEATHEPPTDTNIYFNFYI